MTFEEWWKSQKGRMIVGDPGKPEDVKKLIWAEFIKDVLCGPWMYYGGIGLVIRDAHPLFDDILVILENYELKHRKDSDNG